MILVLCLSVEYYMKGVMRYFQFAPELRIQSFGYMLLFPIYIPDNVAGYGFPQLRHIVKNLYTFQPCC